MRQTEAVGSTGQTPPPTSRGEDPTERFERPSADEAAIDLVLSMIRCVDGIDQKRLRDRTNHTLDVPEVLLHQGLIQVDGERVRLTPSGFPVADAITTRLVDALVAPTD